MGDEQGPDGGGDDAGDDDVPAARIVHGEDDRKQRREDGRQRIQPFLALGDEQGEEHGGQGVVKAEQLGIGQEVAGHRAYERTEHPAAVGGEVGGVHQRKPRLLTCGHGHAVHGENLVREPPADDELLEAGERREPRGHGGGHEHMPQVDHERRENDGKDGRAHPP